MEDKLQKDLKIFITIWALIFFIIGVYPVIYSEDVRKWALVISVFFIVVLLTRPYILLGGYKKWIRIGEFIGSIISHIIMFALYFLVFTPIALTLKILGKDLLNKKINKTEGSYWVKRLNQPQSMKRQF